MARIQEGTGKIISHCPVLLKSAICGLKVTKGGLYIDATVGDGGHSEKILFLGGRILGLDIDPESLKAARRRLECACPVSSHSATALTPKNLKKDTASWLLVQGNFKDLLKIAKEKGIKKVDGILFDLGISSRQLDDKSRGFSFESDAVLDMRMDRSSKVKAADLIAGLGKKELSRLFLKFGDEAWAHKISQIIVEERKKSQITTCRQLAELVKKVKPYQKSKIHPATKVFQALRIAVNDELSNLKSSLPQALKLLKRGGRLVIISFHSGEDRIVKDFFKKQEVLGKAKVITKKPIMADEKEKLKNPRSRSAKLRILEKI